MQKVTSYTDPEQVRNALLSTLTAEEYSQVVAATNAAHQNQVPQWWAKEITHKQVPGKASDIHLGRTKWGKEQREKIEKARAEAPVNDGGDGPPDEELDSNGPPDGIPEQDKLSDQDFHNQNVQGGKPDLPPDEPITPPDPYLSGKGELPTFGPTPTDGDDGGDASIPTPDLDGEGLVT